MKDICIGFAALALLFPIAGCLSLGIGSPPDATGGTGGAGGAGGSGGGAGSCEACNFGFRFGDDAEQTVYALGLDRDGSVFITGRYNGAMFLGPNVGLSDSSPNTEEAFLAKLDPQGVPQWIVNPTGVGTTAGVGAAIALGNGLVAWGGGFGDVADSHDIFIELRSMSDGASPMVRGQFGSGFHDEMGALALSADGQSLYVAGILRGNGTQYSGCPALGAFDAGNDPNLVVLALDTVKLGCKWGKTWTGGNHNPGTIRIAVAGDGHPVVTGAYTSGTLDGTGLPSGDAGFVMKLDSGSGAMLGARSFANVLPLGIAADPSTNRVAVSGVLTGPLTFAGKSAPGPGQSQTANAALMGYDGSLAEKWFQPLAGSVGQFCQGISSNESGRFYAGCLHQGSLTLPNGRILTCPDTDFMCGMLIPLNSLDGTLFSDKAATFGPDQPAKPGATFLTAANANALVMGGSWIAPITFPDGTLLSTNGANTDYDVVVGKVAPAP